MRIDLARLCAAERLLWSYGIMAPDQIDLEGIAADRGAEVIYRPLDGCEARLVASADRAVISVNIGSSEGRRRFSLGHELAHWICDRHSGSFQCAKEAISPQNAEARSVEAHANGYASQLILPDYLVDPWIQGKPVTLNTAKALAADFTASLTAAAIKLAKRAATPACVMCHSQSRLAWHARNVHFSTDFYVMPQLHQDTDAFNLAFGTSSTLTRPRKEPADRWLSGDGAYRQQVDTQSVKLPDGTVLTLLAMRA